MWGLFQAHKAAQLYQSNKLPSQYNDSSMLTGLVYVGFTSTVSWEHEWFRCFFSNPFIVICDVL